jgi:hypothetical protein
VSRPENKDSRPLRNGGAPPELNQEAQAFFLVNRPALGSGHQARNM